MGGDQHARLEQLLEAHKAQDQIFRSQKFGWAGPLDTLADQVRAWFDVRANRRRVESAGKLALAKAEALGGAHDTNQKLLHHRPAPGFQPVALGLPRRVRRRR